MGIIYNVIYIDDFSNTDIMICLGIFLFNYLVGVIFRMAVIKACNKSVKDNIGGILLFDFFILSWLPINFICLFIKDCTWDHIKHDRNVDTLNI